MSNELKSKISQKYCLNCQTELHGKFCHECGQQATHHKPTVKEFIHEYLNIAFVWDQHLLKTIWNLVRKPGHLTNEYVSGKFISYMHPLKLNMFLLFIFITFFLLFHNAEDMGNSLKNITRHEAIYPVLQLELLTREHNYTDLLKSSKVDTVQLYAPLLVSENFPDIIVNVDNISVRASDSLFIWTASIPDKLIEDKVIIAHEEGYYYFNGEHKKVIEDTEIFESVWMQMVRLTTKYFPILIVLTAPFLSFVVRLLHLKGNWSQFRHFVFSLHYIAFLELIIILLYIIHLIASPPTWAMQCIILSVSCLYLTLAIRRVYETKRWITSIWKAVLTNIGYFMILLILLIVIFIVSCTIISFQL